MNPVIPEELQEASASESTKLMTKEEWEPLLKDNDNLSPMIRQYLQIRDENRGFILFFRLGDFYEMFFDDALLVSRELELTLTGKNCGLPRRVPMCGVPHHSSDIYIKKLIEKGYKVAICEQVESPLLARGLVKREVTRVTTPGTVIDSNFLPEGENNFIGSVYLKMGKSPIAGLCFADISTGEMSYTTARGQDIARLLINELSRHSPKELLINAALKDQPKVMTFIRNRLSCVLDLQDDEVYDADTLSELISQQFDADLNGEEVKLEDPTLFAVGSLLKYLSETQKQGVSRLRKLTSYSSEQYLGLDADTVRNLELFKTMRQDEVRGSLLWVLDHTKTAMGKRRMRDYLDSPLTDIAKIGRRQAAVKELYNKTVDRNELSEQLKGVYDLQRLMTKVVYGSVGPRDLLALATAASHLPPIKEISKNFSCQKLSELDRDISELTEIKELIEEAINPDTPLTMKDGGVIRKGYSQELDELTDLQVNAKDYLARLEEEERQKTGIKTLKIGYNRVFGYYLEVSKSFVDQVPPEWVRKQTLVGGERYINQELKDLESRMLYATERILQLEASLFEDVRSKVLSHIDEIETTSEAIAELDVLVSLAEVAVQNRYVCPEVTVGGTIEIIGGRHPVVEKLGAESESNSFIPNDTLLDNRDNKVMVITGPNMAGKSTYMRQVALIVIMAQMGSFVPAQSAVISVVDRIFTRVGASDDLTAGQSTFMVEMNEVATILKNATPDSLVLLDEIGRGTSTFDGMSIARAVVEHILTEKKLGCRTLFATHYHELTELEKLFPGVVNYNIAVRRKGEDIIFLRKIVRGGTDDSFGIEVAKLAGVPQKVISRARVILEQLESSAAAAREVAKEGISEDQESSVQLSLSDRQEEKVLKELRQADIDSMSPRDAMNFLYKLKQMMI